MEIALCEIRQQFFAVNLVMVRLIYWHTLRDTGEY